MIANRLTELSPQLLRQRDIQLVMLDFDNTIVPYTTNEPTEEMETWLRQMADSEFTLCVVSNSRKDRVKKFCAKYGIDCITHARKPFSKGIRQCLDRYGVPAANAVLNENSIVKVIGSEKVDTTVHYGID
jgi:HAD superfamily phosphatase (TIGR01668 family)